MTDSIVIDGVCKSFGDFHLSNINMELPKGCIVGMIGNNGAGKTTLMKCISGAVIPDKGTISFPDTRRSGDIGIVFDECHLPAHLNCTEISKIFAGLVPNWDAAGFSMTLKRFGIPMDKKIEKMSRGMRMKVQTAVALAQSPEILILDEPTAGLDPAARDEFLDDVMGFIQDEGHTVLISSHITGDLERVADYIAFIHDGKLMIFDEKDAILERYGILRCGNMDDLKSIGGDMIVSTRRSEFGCSALVDDRDGLKEAYPEAMIDKATLEDVFIFMVRGENR
ncbi:MAG: ABC transporter ATP-binding protein [Candidatus Methanomethylophilaceae archaeon]